MNIRESENKLFEQWAKKYSHATFIIDGCPNPKVYQSEDRKIIFVLKDGNLGKSYDKPTYDQRNELEFSPHKWWGTISKWCYFLHTPTTTWNEVKSILSSKESVRTILGHHCFIQLKKEGGVGSIRNEKLEKVILKDKDKILKQLAIYFPNYIISCGNGDQLSSLFDCSKVNRKETSHGVGYWEIMLNNSECILVDYCHPSIRAGTKVKGLIAQGLARAISEIESENSNKAMQFAPTVPDRRTAGL